MAKKQTRGAFLKRGTGISSYLDQSKFYGWSNENTVSKVDTKTGKWSMYVKPGVKNPSAMVMDVRTRKPKRGK